MGFAIGQKGEMMDDTISRQAAINSPVKMIAQGLDWVPVYHLEQLPSAERRGRWIENEFGAYCSECGLYAYRSNGIPWKSNYCPICVASMMDDNAIQHTKCVGNALDALDEVEE